MGGEAVHAGYKAIEGSKEKDSVNDKKVFLKISQYTQKNICPGVSFK